MTQDNNKIEPNAQSLQMAVSGSVFFETGKYYHKIWVNGNDHRYFKCDRIVNPNHVHKDAYGTGLYVSPGTSCAQIYLSDYQCKFEGWEEISKEEFILKTKDYVSRAVNELC